MERTRRHHIDLSGMNRMVLVPDPDDLPASSPQEDFPYPVPGDVSLGGEGPVEFQIPDPQKARDTEKISRDAPFAWGTVWGRGH